MQLTNTDATDTTEQNSSFAFTTRRPSTGMVFSMENILPSRDMLEVQNVFVSTENIAMTKIAISKSQFIRATLGSVATMERIRFAHTYTMKGSVKVVAK